jgi:hypothetical protein
MLVLSGKLLVGEWHELAAWSFAQFRADVP